jgi:uncharacterized caspase-like protein
MKKHALLIGISKYQPGLNALPCAVRDIEAIAKVLQHPEMGSFDQIKTLANPDGPQMQEAIELLFSDLTKDDLTLLFFSGHGIKDNRGRLYFATPSTRKHSHGDLIKATAVPASFVQDIMSQSRCKRQVVILDCCFSGAFAEGMTAKGDDGVDVQSQLGGEGRAVLTSSASTQYSFEQQGSDLSVYTRFIVEGIETGIADTDSDGFIAVDELHDYARKKVQDTAPTMNPKIYAVEEGFRIFLAKAPTTNPQVMYRKEVEKFATRGVISTIGRSTLDIQRVNLGLTPETATAIEAEALKPFQEYQAKLQRYEQVLAAELAQRPSLPNTTLRELQSFQEALGLRQEDADAIARRLRLEPEPLDEGEREEQTELDTAVPIKKGQTAELPDIQTLMSATEQSSQRGCSRAFWVTAAIVGLAIVAGAMSQLQMGKIASSDPSGDNVAPPIVEETPVTLPIWMVVVSSESSLGKAQDQVAIAERAGIPAVIFQRKERFAVLVGGGFWSKAEAEAARNQIISVVPDWARNEPFVVDQTTWCVQIQEQRGYSQCQN